jgi:hypothetical protein
MHLFLTPFRQVLVGASLGMLVACAGIKGTALQPEIEEQGDQAQQLAAELQSRALEIQRSYDTRMQRQLARDPACVPATVLYFHRLPDGSLKCAEDPTAPGVRTYVPGGNGTVFWATGLIRVLVDYQQLLASALESRSFDTTADLKALEVRVDGLRCRLHSLRSINLNEFEECPPLDQTLQLDPGKQLDMQIQAAGSLLDIIRQAADAQGRTQVLVEALESPKHSEDLERALSAVKGRLVLVPGVLSRVAREKEVAEAYRRYREEYRDCRGTENDAPKCEAKRQSAFLDVMHMQAERNLASEQLDPLGVAIDSLVAQHRRLRECLVSDECTDSQRQAIAKESRRQIYAALTASVSLARSIAL